MRVFLSFNHQDAQFAARLEEALRRRHIDAWSSLDLATGEQRGQRIDQESANADALVVLVGAGTPISPEAPQRENRSSGAYLESEWRAFLRNDWESSKPLIPVLTDATAEIPSFLRNRKAVAITSLERVVDEIEHLLTHPGESTPPAAFAKAKADQARRLDELKEFALALKEAASSHAGDAQRR